jgi:anti-sigma factor RsiW
MFVRVLAGRYFADAERARTRLLRWRAERRAARAALQDPTHETEPALV